MTLFFVGVLVSVLGLALYGKSVRKMDRNLLQWTLYWGSGLVIFGGIALMVYGGIIQPLLA